MKKTYRFLCLFLVLALSLIAFASCGDENTSSETPSAEVSETSEDLFPLEARNFGGEVIKVLTDQNTDYLKCEIAPTEIVTESVNDAAYNRAQFIEQEYGISLVQEYAESQKNVVDVARENIETGLDEYQIYCAAIYYLAPLGVDGLFYELNSIENGYLHLDAPYWDQSIARDLSLKGSIYFATGDALVTDDESTWCFFFNKDIATDSKITEEYGVDSLYEMVDQKLWTLDNMYAMAKKATINTTGAALNFASDTADTFGLVSQTYDSYTMVAGCEQTLTKNDGNEIRITIGEESNIKAFDKIYNIMMDTSVAGIAEKCPDSQRYNILLQIFANGKGLFMPNKIGSVSNPILRTANIHYGILPMPLYDSNQDAYTSTVTVYWCSALAIPITNVSKLDATCYAMEALAYYGKEMVTPEFYDVTLKNKRFEDTESEEMLDLIFRNRTFDMGAVFNFGSMLSFYTDILLGGNANNHVSKLSANEGTYQNAIDLLMERIDMEKSTN